MAEAREVATLLRPLLATWPEEPFPSDRVAVYAAALADLDADLLRAAIAHCIATLRFFPKPAEIRSAAFELVKTAEGVPDTSTAWGEVMSEISRVGSYGLPRFSHPAIERAVRLTGGWQRICLSETLASDRARFIEFYGQVIDKADRETRMLPTVRQHVAQLAANLRADRPAIGASHEETE